MGRQRGKLITLLLALMLVAGACGSADDAATGAGAETDVGAASEADAVPDEATRGSVAIDAGEKTGAGEELEEAATGTAAVGDESDLADGASGAAPAARGADAGAEGGFFTPEPPPATDRTEANFADYGIRPFVDTDRDPLSTFALDVDTAAYSLARQWLESGALPPPESVRVEEYVNSFDYDYPAPDRGLAVVADAGPSPFDVDNVIVRLGVQAERVANAERPRASLTFVVDTSGSMDRVDRLGVVKTALSRLAVELSPDDTVAIVTYNDDAQVILEPTRADRRDTILDAIDRLRPTGSTNLEAGLVRGYELAGRSFQRGGINRVILASDGIANVGMTDPDGLSRLIRSDADRGIQLVTVGVGMGGFNDVVMEQLADRGDGFYAYVDDVGQAERLFGDELVSTLLTVAIDAKIQVEFDPEAVSRYRLIGFENRAVLDGDFRNDAVDAGDLGAGHQVTALYELTLRDEGGFGGRSDRELGTVRLRWQDPEDGSVDETSLRLRPDIVTDRWADTGDDFRLAVTVAAWAELLRHSPHAGAVTLDQVAAEAAALSPGRGSVEELVGLIEASQRLVR
jgi:Ca-activated chloride channel family protein